MNRYGLSPLIALVLIIGFVASILAMVVSWSLTRSFGEGNPCDGVSIEINMGTNGLQACRDAKKGALDLAVLNSGEKPLAGLGISIKDGPGSADDLHRAMGTHLAGAISEYSFPYGSEKGGISSVLLIPLVSPDGEEENATVCSAQGITLKGEDIKECTP